MVTLTKARKLSGLTQAQLAEKTGLHQMSIYYIETAQVRPRQSTKEKIQSVLSAPVDWERTYYEQLVIREQFII